MARTFSAKNIHNNASEKSLIHFSCALEKNSGNIEDIREPSSGFNRFVPRAFSVKHYSSDTSDKNKDLNKYLSALIKIFNEAELPFKR